MHFRISAPTHAWRLMLTATLILPAASAADSDYAVPLVCQQSAASAVQLVDCLQTQQEILKHIIDYEALLLQADVVHSQRTDLVPPHPERPASPSYPNAAQVPVMERIDWFDQNLEIYAIVGSGDSRTAHARLSGREYRLRIGDQIRLATVTEIEPRAVHLAIPGSEFSVGLSGSATVSTDSGRLR